MSDPSVPASVFSPAERTAVLHAWFGFDTVPTKNKDEARKTEPPVDGSRQRTWWVSTEALDQDTKTAFGEVHARIRALSADALFEQLPEPDDVLAAIITLDQFSRMIFRDDAEAFAQDALARGITKRALLAGVFERVAHPLVLLFGLMPLVHAEDAQDQARGLSLLQQLEETLDDSDPSIATIRAAVKSSHQHKDVIDEFGRFPKRNPALGRTSSAKEKKHQRSDGPV